MKRDASLRVSASLFLCFAAGALAFTACSDAKPPSVPNTVTPATSVTAASAEPEDRGESPAGPRKRKPFELHSSCTEIVTVVFSEDPKAQGASKRTIAPSSTLDGPRDDQGNQTVWLLDDKGEALVKVRVTKGMKQVEIGRSCRTLEAH